MRTRNVIARAQSWWRRVPARIMLGAAVAVVAIAALAWQHYHHQQQDAAGHAPAPTASAPATGAPNPGDLGDNRFEELESPTLPAGGNSVADARAVVTRFATNFGSPNGNRDDWLARISPDLSMQLIEQYRVTDIRNVAQAAVSAVDGPVINDPARVAFDVTYDDGSRIEVRMEPGLDGWHVVDVLPLSSNGLPAPSPAPGTGEGNR